MYLLFLPPQHPISIKNLFSLRLCIWVSSKMASPRSPHQTQRKDPKADSGILFYSILELLPLKWAGVQISRAQGLREFFSVGLVNPQRRKSKVLEPAQE